MIFINKARSKRLATLFAKEFKGTIENEHASFGFFRTCHYRMKFKYKNMRILAYFFHPFCEIWIQNFKFVHEINFTVGKPLPMLGQTMPLNDLLQNSAIPVFSNRSYDIDKTRKFCNVPDNARDIQNVELQKAEYLCIAAGQIIIRNKNRNLGFIKNRLDILSGLFERNSTMMSNDSIQQMSSTPDDFEVKRPLR